MLHGSSSCRRLAWVQLQFSVARRAQGPTKFSENPMQGGDFLAQEAGALIRTASGNSTYFSFAQLELSLMYTACRFVPARREARFTLEL